MFKKHEWTYVPTLSSFITYAHASCLARHYFTNARKTRWSCEGKYTIIDYIQDTHNYYIIFCRPDGRLVKPLLFSTLLNKSPLTPIYFATFEKKREVRSPLPT